MPEFSEFHKFPELPEFSEFSEFSELSSLYSDTIFPPRSFQINSAWSPSSSIIMYPWWLASFGIETEPGFIHIIPFISPEDDTSHFGMCV